jgi:hypothetical protein
MSQAKAHSGLKVRLIATLLLTPVLVMVSFAAPHAEALPKADWILVFKSARTLHLLHDWTLIKSYPIALGPHPLVPDIAER